jgi:hypothetical protein
MIKFVRRTFERNFRSIPSLIVSIFIISLSVSLIIPISSLYNHSLEREKNHTEAAVRALESNIQSILDKLALESNRITYDKKFAAELLKFQPSEESSEVFEWLSFNKQVSGLSFVEIQDAKTHTVLANLGLENRTGINVQDWIPHSSTTPEQRFVGLTILENQLYAVATESIRLDWMEKY